MLIICLFFGFLVLLFCLLLLFSPLLLGQRLKHAVACQASREQGVKDQQPSGGIQGNRVAVQAAEDRVDELGIDHPPGWQVVGHVDDQDRFQQGQEEGLDPAALGILDDGQQGKDWQDDPSGQDRVDDCRRHVLSALHQGIPRLKKDAGNGHAAAAAGREAVAGKQQDQGNGCRHHRGDLDPAKVMLAGLFGRFELSLVLLNLNVDLGMLAGKMLLLLFQLAFPVVKGIKDLAGSLLEFISQVLVGLILADFLVPADPPEGDHGNGKSRPADLPAEAHDDQQGHANAEGDGRVLPHPLEHALGRRVDRALGLFRPFLGLVGPPGQFPFGRLSWLGRLSRLCLLVVQPG